MRVFDSSSSEEVARWVEAGFEKAAKRAMVATAAKVVAHIQNEIIPRESPPPVDRGLYRAGWAFRPIAGGAEVFNNVPHAPFIEYGVRPTNVKIGRAMIDALERWVVRKGIAGKGEARGVAFGIANTMKKRGIFNRGGVKGGLRVLEKAEARLGKFFAEEIRRETRRAFPEGGT